METDFLWSFSFVSFAKIAIIVGEKSDDLLKAEAASPSSSESKEEQSESHFLPRCASPFAFLLAFFFSLFPLFSCSWSLALSGQFAICRCFETRGSLDRRVNYRCVPQPRWVDARRNVKGGKEAAGGRQACERADPAAFVLAP